MYLFQRMVQESVYADGDEMEAICEAARSSGVLVSIGFSEKSRHSNGCLYNSNLTIGTQGDALVHHRKLVLNFFEKLTRSPGDGYGLRIADSQFGRFGTLICGENTNALARYSMIAQAEQVHISTWPAVWPTETSLNVTPRAETNHHHASPSSLHGANYNNLTANRTRAAAHSFEAKCFGIACSSQLGEDAIETIIDGASQPDVVAANLPRYELQLFSWTLLRTGAPLRSNIYQGPEKQYTDALQAQEGILYADMNLDDCIAGKQYHDVVGGLPKAGHFRPQS